MWACAHIAFTSQNGVVPCTLPGFMLMISELVTSTGQWCVWQFANIFCDFIIHQLLNLCWSRLAHSPGIAFMVKVRAIICHTKRVLSIVILKGLISCHTKRVLSLHIKRSYRNSCHTKRVFLLVILKGYGHLKHQLLGLSLAFWQRSFQKVNWGIHIQLKIKGENVFLKKGELSNQLMEGTLL